MWETVFFVNDFINTRREYSGICLELWLFRRFVRISS